MSAVWVLVMVVLNATTGEEVSRTPVGEYDEAKMCMYAAQRTQAEAALDRLVRMECVSVRPNQLGPQS